MCCSVPSQTHGQGALRASSLSLEHLMAVLPASVSLPVSGVDVIPPPCTDTLWRSRPLRQETFIHSGKRQRVRDLPAAGAQWQWPVLPASTAASRTVPMARVGPSCSAQELRSIRAGWGGTGHAQGYRGAVNPQPCLVSIHADTSAAFILKACSGSVPIATPLNATEAQSKDVTAWRGEHGAEPPGFITWRALGAGSALPDTCRAVLCPGCSANARGLSLLWLLPRCWLGLGDSRSSCRATGLFLLSGLLVGSCPGGPGWILQRHQ